LRKFGIEDLLLRFRFMGGGDSWYYGQIITKVLSETLYSLDE
jgi:hypothetical protein